MYVVVGGGVAGVCCVQELLRLLNDEKVKNDNVENGNLEIQIIFIC
uniref:Uncharacterized protein n=1 Tax=Panagrolaimus sp. JU765 TaxID=591449 RepID=A0AC34R6K9_9BILA